MKEGKSYNNKLIPLLINYLSWHRKSSETRIFMQHAFYFWKKRKTENKGLHNVIQLWFVHAIKRQPRKAADLHSIFIRFGKWLRKRENNIKYSAGNSQTMIYINVGRKCINTIWNRLFTVMAYEPCVNRISVWMKNKRIGFRLPHTQFIQ